MLFNSFTFLLFFPAVTVIFFLVKHEYRWFFLLSASIFFYMFFIPIYIFILVVTIVIDYVAGIAIERAKDGRLRLFFLILSIISTCAVLIIFKYYNFFIDTLQDLSSFFEMHLPLSTLNIILPIGLSFHTFQSLSYVVEVYRHRQKAEYHFGIYSLYVLFYPQLVAGPIERPQNLLHQFYDPHSFDYTKAVDGLRLMLWGMFKKVVIADRLSIYVSKVYENPYDHSSLTLLVATYFFAFQIYCDFSGYSDIARGAARVMGFELMVNFKRPYFAKSISEFWSRWHISLSTWFKDYVYIPLGGNRVTHRRWYMNLLTVFAISGLWHGANWTFVVWGLLHGSYLVFSNFTTRVRESFRKTSESFIGRAFVSGIQILVTINLVCIGWIYFRATNMHEANHILRQILSFDGRPLYTGVEMHFVFGVFGIAAVSIIDAILEYFDAEHPFVPNNVMLRWSSYIAAILIILMIGVFDGGQFIYFQF